MKKGKQKQRKAMLYETIHESALDRFKVGRTYEEFLNSLSPIEKVAVCTANLYYQIRGNGFQFWIHNGFVLHHTAPLLDILQSIGTPTSVRVKKMVEAVFAIHKRAEELEAIDEGDGNVEEELDRLAEACNELDEVFFTLDKKLMADVDNYLKQHLGEEVK